MEFKEFFHPHTESSKVRTPEKVLADLLLSSIKDFGEEDREYVRDYALGNWLTPEEKQEVERVIGEWWKENFGFNFNNKSKRNATLRKLLPKDEIVSNKERMLELERFGASPEEKQKLKAVIMKEFPGEVQGIELVFGYPEQLRLGKFLEESNKEEKDLENKRNELLAVGEYNFTLVNWVQKNRHDKEYLRVLWETLGEIADKHNATHLFDNMKAGILAHIAGHEIMETLGVRPRSSKPREDVFFGIDEFGRRGEVIQYKSAKKLSVLKGEAGESQKNLRLGVFENMNGLKYLKELDYKIKKNLENGTLHNPNYYVVEIPSSAYDSITGKVNGGVLAQIKEKGCADLDTHKMNEVLEKESVLREEIEKGTSAFYEKQGNKFDASRDKYLLTEAEYVLLLRQALLRNTREFPANAKGVLFGFMFDGVTRKNENELWGAIRDVWNKIPGAPSFDNKEEVGDYLYRTYLRDVDYGWKKRDMAGGTGVSGGK